MSSDPKQIWFPAKRYGWGWGPPICWQGWVVYALFFISLMACAFLFPPKRYICCAGGLAIALVAVCWIKGERPRWRWGSRPPDQPE
jgi:hypothetical protein